MTHTLSSSTQAMAVCLVMALLALALPSAHARVDGALVCEGRNHRTYTGTVSPSVTLSVVPCSPYNSANKYCSFEWIGSGYAFQDWDGVINYAVVKATCPTGATAGICTHTCTSDGYCKVTTLKTCPVNEEALISFIVDNNARRTIDVFDTAHDGADDAEIDAMPGKRELPTADTCVLEHGCCDIVDGTLLFDTRCGATCNHPCSSF